MASFSPPLLPSANLRIIKRGAIAASKNQGKASAADQRPWWAPLFRSIIRERDGSEDPPAEYAGSVGKEEDAVRRSGLTAEKARVLRREMRATETWHDAMYHSAIASRLASPDQP